MGFNLEDYEDVATLNRWFQDNYPMGRIELEVISDNPQQERIVIMASIYRDANDVRPAVQNIARGKQEEYNRNMARFYGEDVATSAIGRAILLLKGAERTAHKEGVARAAEAKYAPNKFEKRIAEKIPVEKPSDPWTIEQKPMPVDLDDALKQLNDGIKPEEIPMCKHGAMKQMQGVGKTNKPYFGYVCTAHKDQGQCPPLWYVMDKAGRWIPPKQIAENGELQ